MHIIGLHCYIVPFGNNWMEKFPRTAKTGPGRRPSSIWLSEEIFEFFEFHFFEIGQACSALAY